MKFITNSILIAIKEIKFKIIILLIILLSAGLIARCTAIFAENYLKSSDFKMNVSIVNHDKNEVLNDLINIALTNAMIKDDFIVEIFDNLDEAMTAQNKPVAIIELPEDVFNSIIVGENISPIVYINRADPLFSTVIENFSDSLSKALKNAQTGVYTVLDIGRENGLSDGDFIWNVNFRYINYVINSNDVIEENLISYSKILDLSQHYSISLIVFMLFLSASLFFNQLNISSYTKMIKHIYAVKKSYQIFFFAKFFVIFLLYFAVLITLCAFLQMQFNFVFVMSVVNVTVFMFLLSCLVFNLSKNFVAVSIINFTLQSAFLFVAGGIIPTVLLPKFVADLQILSPIFYIREVLSQGLISNYDSTFTNLILLICNLVFLLLVYAMNHIKIKKGAYVSDF